MTENEQIEEMEMEAVMLANDIWDLEHLRSVKDNFWLAKELRRKGYRRVERGEWIVTETERAWNNAEIPMKQSCDKCGLQRNIETQVGWNFCPHCGADMRGNENENSV